MAARKRSTGPGRGSGLQLGDQLKPH